MTDRTTTQATFLEQALSAQLNLFGRQFAVGFLACSLVLLLLLAGSLAFANASSNLNQDIINLSAGEKAHDEALLRLRAADKGELVAAVRVLLKQSATQGFAVRAISELELKSLQPEVDALVRTTQSFDVLQAATVSLPELHAKLASLIGQKKNSALKSTLIAKITDALTDDEFSKLIRDDDYLVRESVVSQFFVALSTLPAAKQRSRFEQLRVLKPVQARESAMRLYKALAPSLQRVLMPGDGR